MMRKKRHFFVPIDLWLDKELNLLTEKFLSREYVERQGIFNYAYIEKMRKGFNKSKLIKFFVPFNARIINFSFLEVKLLIKLL